MTGKLTIQPGTTLQVQGTLQSGATLFTASPVSGTFASVSGLPANYTLIYGANSITALRNSGLLLMFR